MKQWGVRGVVMLVLGALMLALAGCNTMGASIASMGVARNDPALYTYGAMLNNIEAAQASQPQVNVYQGGQAQQSLQGSSYQYSGGGPDGRDAYGNPMKKGYPYGIPTGTAGLVKSPYAQDKALVDVSHFASGNFVRCPHTGKIFVVP